MNGLFQLPALLRLFFFTIFTFLLIVLLILIFYKLFSKHKDVFLISYLLSLFFSILLLSISRTPIDRNISEIAFDLSNYSLFLPLLFSIILAFIQKRWFCLIDAVVIFFNLPFCSFISYWEYIYIGSVYYLLIRVMANAHNIYINSKKEPGIYMIKNALHCLEYGILLSNDSGQIIFINESMKKYLEMLDVTEHLKINDIVFHIVNGKYNKRVLSDYSLIVSVNEIAINFQFKKNDLNNNYSQIICVDITERENLLIELENVQHNIEKNNADLLKTLKAIEINEKNNEVLKIKGNIHDTLSQRLSILHCYMIENKIDNISQIKQLIITMLPDMYNDMYNDTKNNEYEKLKSLIDSFAIVNVSLKIKGELPKDFDKANFVIKTIRECSTNAVKHGNATEVCVDINNLDDGHYNILITNNGLTTNKIYENNGLKNIKYQLEKFNGKMKIETTPKFKISFDF